MPVAGWRSAALNGSERLLLWLIPPFLLVDWCNGALLQLHGSSYGLSLLYKLVLLLLLAVALLLQRPGWLLLLAGLLLLMLAGPALHWPKGGINWPLADIQLAVKALGPLLALGYCVLLSQRQPEQAQLLLMRTLCCSGAILLGNTLLGLAGFGFSAYQPLDGVAQPFLGIKGFFVSSNELAAVLLVITAALLVWCWTRSYLAYAAASVCSVAIAVLLLTKTGVLGTVLLVITVPVLWQSNVFWWRHKRLLLAVAVAGIAVLLVMLLNGKALLELLGIYDKLQFVYQQRGVAGILLSSRDYYAGRIWHTVVGHYPDWQQWLGVGQGGVALYLKKYFAELDWFDLLIFHGVAGLAVWLLTFATLFRLCWQQRHRPVARVLLMLNLLLLLVSAMAGHILTSGMVWLPWALVHLLLYRPLIRRRDERSA